LTDKDHKGVTDPFEIWVETDRPIRGWFVLFFQVSYSGSGIFIILIVYPNKHSIFKSRSDKAAGKKLSRMKTYTKAFMLENRGCYERQQVIDLFFLPATIQSPQKIFLIHQSG